MSGIDTFIRTSERGATQSGLRDRNARLVLSYLRRHGELSGAEIARRSGLSAQTVSNIIRALEGNGLVQRGKAIKGKVGKPSIPMALNPQGVLSLGLNIGRRSAELVLVDFNGRLIDSHETAYDYPEIETVFAFLEDATALLFARNPEARDRAVGLGVARPNEIWNWLELVNAPAAAMEKWRALDLGAALSRITGLEATIENDATSACVAEHMLGQGADFTDFLCIFVGAFVGGGLVLGGKIVWGRTGNSAALGPMPIPHPAGGTTQLLSVASLHVLEASLQKNGINPARLRESPDDWSAFEPLVGDWIEATAANLGLAAASVASVIEVEAILIDGAMPEEVRHRLTQATRAHFSGFDLSGVERPRIVEGSVGRRARSLGAALLPIHSRYFIA